MLVRTAILCLAVLLPTSQKKETDEAAAHLALLSVHEWPDVIDRDRRSSFGLRTGPSALRDLDRPDSTESQRAAAVLALGCAQIVSERPRIEALAAEGKAGLKQSAIWALGALRSGNDVPRLVELAGKRTAVSEAAVLALALNGTADALANLSRLAADTSNPIHERATAALDYLRDATAESEFMLPYLRLRFDAARRYGLVDGQAWEVLLIDDLARNQKFVARVIYRAAAELRQPGIRDHFLEAVMSAGPPERLRGAVIAMPSELSQLVESELFKPADEREWATLLGEIERRKVESLTEALLRKAWVVPGLRGQASYLLARGGAAGALQLLDVDLRSGEPAERALAAHGLGAVGNESYLPNLAALEDDPMPAVRAAALVARARIGEVEAMQMLREDLELEESDGKRSTLREQQVAEVEALLRCGNDVRMRDLMWELLERVPERAAARLAAELVLGGYPDAKPIVRERLKTETPRDEWGVRAVMACAHEASLADLAVLRDLFPIGDDMEVDAELACALLRAKDAEVMPILRSALWSEPWNRSVLAGALWISVSGIDGLRLELQRPPSGASQRDLRRVGFALGEWGGEGEVEWLSSRVSPADPALQGAVLGALGARTH